MLSMISLSLGGFGFLVWRSYRKARTGQSFQPEGKVRWAASEEAGER